MVTEEKQKLLEEFAEYAHKYYLGCGKVLKHGEMINDYSYDTQVGTIVEDFLKEDKKVKVSECVFCDMSVPFGDFMDNLSKGLQYGKHSATWGEHIKNHNK